MPSFELFRVKVITSSAQMSLPEIVADHPPGEFLRAAIFAKPSFEPRRGYIWHVGNVEAVRDRGLYFALGRTTKSTLETFDERSGNFKIESVDNAPYTHVVIDLRLQVCAIAAKPELAPTPMGIARQLAKLLNHQRSDKNREVVIEPIRDPEDFIKQLEHAYQIFSFTIEFSRPNPFDAEEDFQRPLQKAFQAASGDRGKTTLKGRMLNPEPLAVLARAAAAAGNEASAKLKSGKKAKTVTRQLRGNPASFSLTAEERQDVERMKPGVLSRIREIYRRVRGPAE